MKRASLLVAAMLALSAPVFAQQTVAVTSSTLPNGASTAAKQDTLQTAIDAIKVDVDKIPAAPSTAGGQTTGNASLSSIDGKITAVNTGAVVVSSSALPSGAATSAKQPALGTAGTAASDVLTVQGISGMTALKVDGSAVTQPVSIATMPSTPVTGTFWQATQPVSGTFWQATQPISAASLPGTGSTGSAVPAAAHYLGAQDASGGLVGDVVCANSKIYDASTSGNTELVAISGSKHIYICSYEFFAAGTVNVSLVTGTGTACASSASGTPSTGTSGASAALTPAFQFTAQSGKLSAWPTHGWLLDAGAANALCLKTSAGIAVQAQVWYSQR